MSMYDGQRSGTRERTSAFDEKLQRTVAAARRVERAMKKLDTFYNPTVRVPVQTKTLRWAADIVADQSPPVAVAAPPILRHTDAHSHIDYEQLHHDDAATELFGLQADAVAASGEKWKIGLQADWMIDELYQYFRKRYAFSKEKNKLNPPSKLYDVMDVLTLPGMMKPHMVAYCMAGMPPTPAVTIAAPTPRRGGRKVQPPQRWTY